MAANFPLRAPVGLLGGGLLALISFVPILAGWQALQPPVQRFYLGQYVVTYLSATPVGTVAAFFKGSKEHTYHVLGQNGHLVYRSVPEAGPVSVHVMRGWKPSAFHAWLRAGVYGGRETPDLFRVPLGTWCAAVLLFFSLGAALDFSRRKRAREGQQLRGGALLSVAEFNRATKGDGFGLYVK